MDLSTATAVLRGGGKATHGSEASFDWCFTLHTPERDWPLIAESAQACVEWVALLKRCLKR